MSELMSWSKGHLSHCKVIDCWFVFMSYVTVIFLSVSSLYVWGLPKSVMSMLVVLMAMSWLRHFLITINLYLSAFVSFLYDVCWLVLLLCQTEPVSLVIVYLNTIVTISEHALTLLYIFTEHPLFQLSLYKLFMSSVLLF